MEAVRPARVVFVLVEAPAELWRRRFGARDVNTVPIGLAAADAYIRDNWHDPAPDFVDERVVNGDDATEVDSRMRSVFERWCNGLAG